MGVLESELNIYEFTVKNKDRVPTVELGRDIRKKLGFRETEIRVRRRDSLRSDTKDISFLVYSSSGGSLWNDQDDIVKAVKDACSEREIQVDYLGSYRLNLKQYIESKF